MVFFPGENSDSGASLIARLVKNPPAMQETPLRFWVGKIPWRRDRLPTPVFRPGEFHGLYSPWGLKESDTTERLSLWAFVFFKKFQDNSVNASGFLKVITSFSVKW